MSSSSLLVFFIFGCIIITALASAVIIYVRVVNGRQVAEGLARQQLQFDFQEALLRSRLEAQETTLSAVSLELHDSVNQMLTSGVFQFRIAEEYMRHAEGLDALRAGRASVQQAIASIRALSHSLHTEVIADMSLAEAIEQELKRAAASKAFETKLEVEGDWEPGHDARLIIYRIVQEALQNVHKHAAAKQVVLRVRSTPDNYSLSISDDGIGFDTAAPTSAPTLGLRSMQERISLLQGKFSLLSEPGSGTTINLNVPIRLDEQ